MLSRCPPLHFAIWLALFVALAAGTACAAPAPAEESGAPLVEPAPPPEPDAPSSSPSDSPAASRSLPAEPAPAPLPEPPVAAPDDHGDTAAEATVVAVDAAVPGTIGESPDGEEPDRDVFVFTAEAGVRYQIVVADGTLESAEVALYRYVRESDFTYIVAATDGQEGLPFGLSWEAPAAPARDTAHPIYVEVRPGAFGGGTGSYTLIVVAQDILAPVLGPGETKAPSQADLAIDLPAVPAGPFTAIAVAGQRACAWTEAGARVCWGGSGRGRWSGLLFFSSTIDPPCWVTAAGATRCLDAVALTGVLPSRYMAISRSWDARCGLTYRGAVECQYYDGPNPPAGTYTAISVGRFSRQDASSSLRACAVATDGALVCWGAESVYPYDPDNPFRPYTERYPGDYVSVHAYGLGFCALTADGRVIDHEGKRLLVGRPGGVGGLQCSQCRRQSRLCAHARRLPPSAQNPPLRYWAGPVTDADGSARSRARALHGDQRGRGVRLRAHGGGRGGLLGRGGGQGPAPRPGPRPLRGGERRRGPHLRAHGGGRGGLLGLGSTWPSDAAAGPLHGDQRG